MQASKSGWRLLALMAVIACAVALAFAPAVAQASDYPELTTSESYSGTVAVDESSVEGVSSGCDYLVFTPASTGLYTFTVEKVSGTGSLAVTIDDNDATEADELGYTPGAWADDEETACTSSVLVGGETYTIELYRYTTDELSYTLSVAEADVPVLTASSPHVARLDGNSGCGHETWVSFTPAASATYSFTLSAEAVDSFVWVVLSVIDETGKDIGVMYIPGGFSCSDVLEVELTAGETYYLRAVSLNDEVDIELSVGSGMITRLAGGNRYETMAAIVEAAYSGETCDVAVLATGANFADALAAASLAGALDAPIVLVKPGDPSAAIEVLQELGCGYAYVIGGTSAVAAADVAAIEAACGVETERISGDNRRETALAVAQAANAQMGASARSDTCIVATGAEFADALSASPYSYWAAAPIYLTKTDGAIDQVALDAIEEAGYSTVVIMGGASAVTAASEAAIRALGVEVVRLEGGNRYDTCAEMAAWSVAQGMSYDGAAVATGASFPDALAGATLCGRTGSVILLAKDNRTQAVDLLADASDVGGIYVLGGESAVSASLLSYLEETLG